MKWIKTKWFKKNHPETLQVVASLSSAQQLEKTMANLRLAIENSEYVFPEFSSLEVEEAKSLSLKALSIAGRLFQLGESDGGTQD